MSRLGVIAAPLSLVLALLAALAFVSCGSGDDAQLLPGGTAREITANLDTVKQLAEEGECLGAEDAAEQVDAEVEALQGVEPELKRALEHGTTRLNEVVDTCEEAVVEEPPSVLPETTEAPSEDEEKEDEEGEKEKEDEKEEKEDDEEAETEPPTEVPPPHSNGQGKGPDGDEAAEGGPSGGIGPGNAVGGDD